MKKKIYNLAFFAYDLKTQTNIHFIAEINNLLSISILLIIAAIFLSSKTKAIIVNVMKYNIQNLQ